MSSLRDHWFWKEYPIAKEFLKYSIVGTAMTLVDFSVYVALTRTFFWWEKHFLFANGAAFIFAVTISFFVNRNWTFRKFEKGFISHYPPFAAVNIIGLLLSQTALYILVSSFFIHDIVAKIGATIVVILWRFAMYKYWVFR